MVFAAFFARIKATPKLKLTKLAMQNDRLDLPASLTRLEIPINAGKAFLYFLASVAGLAIGIAMRHDAPWTAVFVIVVMGAFVLFRGAVLFSRQPGLVLEPGALLISDMVGSGGRVPWGDMTAISLYHEKKTRGSLWLLIIKVNDTQKYMEQTDSLYRKGFLYRQLNAFSAGVRGSPVCVNVALLDVDRLDLERVANAYLDKYGDHTLTANPAPDMDASGR